MPNHFIKLLSDTVANQIAAGEVIQRPASVVKELLENSIDAGANSIQLIIKDAGKTLIQVIDNGCGMNEVDARLCFERHATSKISLADDLFKIKTMGFRGEALASIASIAQVELKTKTHDNQLGTNIKIEGSQIISQEACQTLTGTSIAVKNLFFNIPVRREFLKSNQVEMKHIYDEFHRIALANPDVKFVLIDNANTKFQLDSGNFKNRIVKIFGNSYQKRIIPIEQQTDYVQISGFLLKPEFAKKTRGDQFFFVNKRFIRHFYFHRIIFEVFKDYIPQDMQPGYFININIAPDEIDVNVHPTKTEIVFKDEHTLASILRSAVKYAIGAFNVAPTIDFDVETAINLPLYSDNKPIKLPTITINPNYNPFSNEKGFKDVSKVKYTDLVPKNDTQAYQSSIHNHGDKYVEKKQAETLFPSFLYAHNKYIVSLVKSGIMFIDVSASRQRIAYNKILHTLENSKINSSQQLLYPETIELSAKDTEILMDMLSELELIGFGISHLGGNTFSCTSTPSEFSDIQNIHQFIETLMELYQADMLDARKEKNKKVAYILAKRISTQIIDFQNNESINQFIEELFSTEMPDIAPDGNKTYWLLTNAELDTNFKLR